MSVREVTPEEYGKITELLWAARELRMHQATAGLNLAGKILLQRLAKQFTERAMAIGT